MRSFNLVVVDLVRNPEGELLAVSSQQGICCSLDTFYRTVKDGTELAEDSPLEYYFKRKSDIKKIRKSKEKDRMIDRLNLWILEANVAFLGYALEKAEDALFSYADKELLKSNEFLKTGERWYEDLPESLNKIETAARYLNRGGRAYNNYLKLCMRSGVGAYGLQIERVQDHWNRKE